MMQPLDGSDIVDTLPLGAPGPQGEFGPRGLPGPQGIPGIPGSLGPIGLSVYSGNSTPDSNFGREGETFVVPTTGDIFRKSANSWVLLGNIRGYAPQNQVDGIRFRFTNPDGSWGDWVELAPLEEFADRAETAADRASALAANYLGAFPSTAIPSNANGGGPLLTGMLYFNSTDSEMKVRNAAGQWQTQVPGAADYYTKPAVDSLNAAQDTRIASLEAANLTARQVALAIAYSGVN